MIWDFKKNQMGFQDIEVLGIRTWAHNCHSSLNGGTCTDMSNDYACACAAGFSGKTCEGNFYKEYTKVWCIKSKSNLICQVTLNPNWHELWKQEKCSYLTPHRSKTQCVKLSQFISIFTSKNIWKFLIKIQLTKSGPKIIRGVYPPCLMPIRVKGPGTGTYRDILASYEEKIIFSCDQLKFNSCNNIPRDKKGKQ